MDETKRERLLDKMSAVLTNEVGVDRMAAALVKLAAEATSEHDRQMWEDALTILTASDAAIKKAQ